MATMKRRIVYISDEEWARLGTYAKASGITISEAVRRAFPYLTEAAALSTRQAVETAIDLSKQSGTWDQLTGPSFGQSRPAPKPGRK